MGWEWKEGENGMEGGKGRGREGKKGSGWRENDLGARETVKAGKTPEGCCPWAKLGLLKILYCWAKRPSVDIDSGR